MVAINDTFGMALLTSELTRDEGSKAKLYDDASGKTIAAGMTIRGKITGGVGHNFSDDGLSPDQIDYLLQGDIAGVLQELDKNIPWWRGLDATRQRVIINMCFNMGWTGLATFTQTLSNVQHGAYSAAAQGMRESRWATQVGARATRLCSAMETGVMLEPAIT